MFELTNSSYRNTGVIGSCELSKRVEGDEDIIYRVFVGKGVMITVDELTKLFPETEGKKYQTMVMQANNRLGHSSNSVSDFAVSAIVDAENEHGDISLFTGSNQEHLGSNSNGGCAEHIAVSSARNHGYTRGNAIVITANPSEDIDNPQPITPCGACRGDILEMIRTTGTDMVVFMVVPGSDKVLVTTFSALYPGYFPHDKSQIPQDIFASSLDHTKIDNAIQIEYGALGSVCLETVLANTNTALYSSLSSQIEVKGNMEVVDKMFDSLGIQDGARKIEEMLLTYEGHDLIITKHSDINQKRVSRILAKDAEGSYAVPHQTANYRSGQSDVTCALNSFDSRDIPAAYIHLVPEYLDKDEKIPSFLPTGDDRQQLYEFQEGYKKDIPYIQGKVAKNESGDLYIKSVTFTTIRALLPHAFGKKDLGL